MTLEMRDQEIREEGFAQGYIEACRKGGVPEDVIIAGLIEKLSLTEEIAKNYLKNQENIIEESREDRIKKYIAMGREIEMPDSTLMLKIMKIYSLSEKEAKAYLSQFK